MRIMNKSIRNIIIFAIASIGGGFLGIYVDSLNPPQDTMQGLGVLIWLVTPLLTNILLRTFGGDGWKDFGLGFNFRSGGFAYLVAILTVPFVTLLTLGLGAVLGAFTIAGSFSNFLPLLGIAFAGAMVKNIFEEFAWRGYLTPRFEAVKINVFLGYILTGFIWAGWHIPYYLYFLPRAELNAHVFISLPAFLLLAFIDLPFHAFAYGELRRMNNSVWPAWLMHNIANAISLPLLSSGFIVLTKNFMGVLLSPGTEGIIHSLLMGAVGYWLYRRRMANQE